MPQDQDSPSPPAAGWRFKLGAAFFALSILGPPVVLPIVTALGLSAGTTATVSGGVLVGAELLLLAAVAVMGKEGYAFLKARIFAVLKRYGPPQEVSRTRYTIGLVMFAVPLILGWLAPYLGGRVPGYAGNEVAVAIGGDVLLLASLAVLGGDFWDKLRALFIHDARVVFR